MIRGIALGLALATLLFGCKRKPCTKCPNIAGSYKEEVKAGGEIECYGYDLVGRMGADTVTITQNGSALTLESDGLHMTGTLYDNNSVSFGDEKWQSYNNVTSETENASMTLTGYFAPGHSAIFSGTYQITFSSPSNSQSCTMNQQASWTN
jgi:hypothetical protein